MNKKGLKVVLKEKLNFIKRIFLLNFIGTIFLTGTVAVKSEVFIKEKLNTVDTSYLESKNNLKDYILDIL